MRTFILFLLALLLPLSGMAQTQGATLRATNSTAHGSLRYGSTNEPYILAIDNQGTNIFGPFTPGTTTYGIQEAVNSFSKGSSFGPLANNAELRFSGDYFYYTNAIYVTNLYPAGITWKGASMLSTKLVYAGVAQGISTINFGSLNNPAAGSISRSQTIRIEDVGFTAINNTTNILVTMTNYASLDLTRLLFTSWQMMTNVSNGSGVSIVDNVQTVGGTPVPGLVGLVTSSGLEIYASYKDLYFIQLACGMDTSADNVDAAGIRGAFVGMSMTSGGSFVKSNLWPNTSPYGLGAVVVRRSGLPNSIWQKCLFYRCYVGFALTETGETPQLLNMRSESTDFPMITDGYSAGLDATVYYSTGFTPTGMASPLGNWADGAKYYPTNVANPFVYSMSLNASTFDISVAGTNVFSVGIANGRGLASQFVALDSFVGGTFHGEASGLTNQTFGSIVTAASLTVNAASFLASTNQMITVEVDATAGARVVTLNTNIPTGKIINVKKVDASANAVTVYIPNGYLDGATNRATTTQWINFQIQKSALTSSGSTTNFILL